MNEARGELQQRVADFSKSVLHLFRGLPLDVTSRPIISQLVRSATSIGANYMESTGASSGKDFTYKLFICKKEAQETEYWLDLLSSMFDNKAEEIMKLKSECHEFILIFQAATKTMREKMKIEK